jgi:hypothetical protein
VVFEEPPSVVVEVVFEDPAAVVEDPPPVIAALPPIVKVPSLVQDSGKLIIYMQ